MEIRGKIEKLSRTRDTRIQRNKTHAIDLLEKLKEFMNKGDIHVFIGEFRMVPKVLKKKVARI